MICLLVILIAAVVMDVKSYKIRNSLILFGLILGLIFLMTDFNKSNLLFYLGGAILPILLLFPLFILKALGAGDIKLFAVIGFFCGYNIILKVMLYSLFVGGFMSIIQLFRSKNFYESLIYFIKFIRYQLKSPSKIITYSNIKREGYLGVIHYSIAILIAYLIILWRGFII